MSERSAAPDYFIFGAERSGSTLLCALVNESASHFILNDSFAFQAADNLVRSAKIAFDAVLSPREVPLYFANLYRQYAQREYGKYMWLEEYARRTTGLFGPLVEESYQETLTLAEIVRRVVEALAAPNANGRWIGEKTPDHVRRLDCIKALAPSVPGIVIMRNPAHNIAATDTRRKWPVKRLIDHYRTFYPEDVHCMPIVRYEDLAAGRLAGLKKAFASIAPDDAPGGLGDFRANDRIRAGKFDMYVKGYYVGTSVEPERATVYETYFPDRTRQMIEAECADLYALWEGAACE